MGDGEKLHLSNRTACIRSLFFGLEGGGEELRAALELSAMLT